jgi:hypothetical protein
MKIGDLVSLHSITDNQVDTGIIVEMYRRYGGNGRRLSSDILRVHTSDGVTRSYEEPWWEPRVINESR